MADSQHTKKRPRQLPEGMWLRGKVYYARFRSNGRLICKRLTTDYRVACWMLNDLKVRADQGRFDILDNDVALEEIERQWLRNCEQTLRPRSVRRYRDNLANIKRRISVRKVSQLTIRVVTDYRDKRLTEGVSPRTVNMEVGAVSTMLRWAVDHQLIGSNPLAKVKPLPNDCKRKVRRALTVEEVEAIFEASPKWLRPVWLTFMTTGMRRSELANMRFQDVDHERKVVTVQSWTAKNHKAREVPLSDEVLEIIRRLESEAGGREHVFVNSAGRPWGDRLLNQFYAVCRVAGVEGAYPGGNVDIHALRVSFITLAMDHGAQAKAIQSIVGHATLAMTTDVYAKATDRSKREAIDALPFATASGPEHVLSLVKGAETKEGEACAQRIQAVGTCVEKPLAKSS